MIRPVTEEAARAAMPSTDRSSFRASASAGGSSTLLVAGVMLVAASMRPLATSVGPVLHQISAGEHLSGAVAGLLSTIPVLCFGAIAPLAGLLSGRLGIARTIALVLCAIIAGLALRVSGGAFPPFAGTLLAAAGASCGTCCCRCWCDGSLATASTDQRPLHLPR